MTKKNPVYLTVLLVALSIVLTFQITFLATEGYKNDSNTADTQEDISESVISDTTLAKIKEIAAQYAAYYPGEIDAETVEKYIISAMIAGIGDDFGAYYDASSFNSKLEQIAGSYSGIGITASYSEKDGFITVASVSEGSPAEQAGLLAGDKITHIGSGESKMAVSDIGYEKAVELIRGEKGTYVLLTLVRAESTLELSVMRDDIISKTVSWHPYSKNESIAVIKITKFEKTTVEQFKTALAEAEEQGAKAYVFDLRSNPGGELGAVTSMLDLLLPEGPIIRIEYKDENKNSQINSDAECIKAPMAVLCDSVTASAGELFCAALKDYNVATLIGTKTFGKGTMQSVLRLSDGSGVSITIAYYLPPFSENYHGIGVEPHITLELADDIEGTLTDENDNQLHAAVSELTGKMQ